VRSTEATFWFLLTASLVMPASPATKRQATKRQAHPYRTEWKHKTFGKKALMGVGAGAGLAHARNSPRQWGQGASGLTKRAGFGLAGHAVKTTVEHAVAAPLHEDLHYNRARSKKVMPRLRHALVSTVIARNTRSRKHQIAVGKLSGHAASGAFSAAVVPAASGAGTAGISMGVSAGSNVAREFWPRHHLRHKR
jgi:hypothetical protein